MRAAATALLAVLVLAAPAEAARVDLMVVGKSRVLRDAAPVKLARASARVGGKRCRFAARTPLAALLRTRLRVRLRDFGSCSRRPRDGGAVYVRGIGRDTETRRGGWVYKLGRRTPGTGAGDPASRLRKGGRLVWFWCVQAAEGCPRTLEADAARSGTTLTVTVTGYDDNGRGARIEGATVTAGDTSATTGADGVAVLTVPSSGTLEVVASKPGTVRSFPEVVR